MEASESRTFGTHRRLPSTTPEVQKKQNVEARLLTVSKASIHWLKLLFLLSKHCRKVMDLRELQKVRIEEQGWSLLVGKRVPGSSHKFVTRSF
jgi:hypothetical protein